MHPNEPHDLDFTLDDIIREFSEPEMDDILQEPVPQPEPIPPEQIPMTADTVRLDTVTAQISPASVSQNTAVFQPLAKEPAPEMPEEMPENMLI